MPETFDIKSLEKRMDGALASLKTEFSGLRTGRASIHVETLSTINAITASSAGICMNCSALARCPRRS